MTEGAGTTHLLSPCGCRWILSDEGKEIILDLPGSRDYFSRTGHLEPLTATGAFNIRLLHLNRPQLVAQRLERQALDVERQRLQLLQSEIEQSEQTIRVLEQYINFLLRFGASENSPEDD
jgi:hypothetical protein